MSMHRKFICVPMLAVALSSTLACAEGANLGTPIGPRDLAGWDISVMPDGTGLPAGSGTPAQGERIFAEKCVACHGADGKGAAGLPLSPLFGDVKITDISAGMKTIANFWPYATTPVRLHP